MAKTKSIDFQLGRRRLVQAYGLAGAVAVLGPSVGYSQTPNFKGRVLVAQGFGGQGQDAVQATTFDWLDKTTGAKSSQVPMQSAPAFARMRAETANPEIDMYVFSGGQEVVAAKEGFTQPLGDIPALSRISANLKDPGGHWVTWGAIAEGILYRTDKIKEKPTSYKDFLRPELQGHIAFPAISNGYGLDFLIMLARTHGGSERNIEPGFAALKKISAKATIFRAASDVQTLFTQGDVWMLPYDSATAARARAQGVPIAFAVPTEGSPAVFLTAVIARNTKNADLARATINRLLSPEAQTEVARAVAWGPTNPDTKLPPDVAANIPPVTALLNLDRDYINANRSAWTDRWNREIAAK